MNTLVLLVACKYAQENCIVFYYSVRNMVSFGNQFESIHLLTVNYQIVYSYCRVSIDSLEY